MTHSGGKPHNIGDRGQRYEVRATGWPKDGESAVGWTDDLKHAEKMASSILKAPSCAAAAIIERAMCTICATVESPHFYHGCAVRDGYITDWQCDGEGHLTRFIK